MNLGENVCILYNLQRTEQPTDPSATRQLFCMKVTRTFTNTLCNVHVAKFYCISKRSVENISTEKFTFKYITLNKIRNQIHE
jgi:hypothetical protein